MLRKALLFAMTFFISFQSDAAGSITHMFIAHEIAAQLPNKELKELIQNNMDAYLVGSAYPETGYIRGTHYGNDSHWEKFISAFVDYLHEHYSYPEQQNPKLVAFLLGCATNVESNQVFYGTFMHKIALEDFHGNWQKARQQTELGLDALINIDKNQWRMHPVVWWLPLHDLVAIYKKMGIKNHYQIEIFWGNTIYSLGSIGERALSPLNYYYAKSQMPWLAKNYYSSPQGGLLMTETITTNYLLKLWDEILLKKRAVIPRPQPIHPLATLTPSFTFTDKPAPEAKSGWYGGFHVEFI